jgi:hypothetical protein
MPRGGRVRCTGMGEAPARLMEVRTPEMSFTFSCFLILFPVRERQRPFVGPIPHTHIRAHAHSQTLVFFSMRPDVRSV